MLKHRIQGINKVHGGLLFVLMGLAFVGHQFFLKVTGLVTFTASVNWMLYFSGVLAAMLWVGHTLAGVGVRLVTMSWFEIARLSVQQWLRIAAVIFTLAFATRDLEVSRAFLLSFAAEAFVLLFVANLTLPHLLVRIFFRAQPMRSIIHATSSEALALRDWVKACGEYGVELVGYVSDEPEAVSHEGLPYLGRAKDLPVILRNTVIDQVVADQRLFDVEQARAFSTACEQAGTRVRFYLNMDTMFPGLPALKEHNGAYSFAAYTPEPLENPLNRIIKRCFDIAVALPVVVCILPPLTLVVLLVQRLQSPGPVFYRQQRSGMNRRKFEIFKFRTMHLNNTVATQATRNDSRIYAFGRFLRKSSLDELPQFLNVLRGEMSVNGPRPHLIEHDEQFAKVVTSYRKRHFVKPGITGLAQSKGFRGEVTERRAILNRVRYDMVYVANWSLWLDLRILLATARQVLFPPKSAY